MPVCVVACGHVRACGHVGNGITACTACTACTLTQAIGPSDQRRPARTPGSAATSTDTTPPKRDALGGDLFATLFAAVRPVPLHRWLRWLRCLCALCPPAHAMPWRH